jgi:uracil-DNA glycosylase
VLQTSICRDDRCAERDSEHGLGPGRLSAGHHHNCLFLHAFLRWHYPDQVPRVGGALSRPLSPVAPSSPYAPGIVAPERLVAELAAARIGTTFNQYAEGSRAPLLRKRLTAYLEERAEARVLLVGEAPGYRGARVSGIPFTSERQLTGSGSTEATATIVHRVLAELGLRDSVLLWNIVPTHPGTASTNRPPTRAEIAAGTHFAHALGYGRRIVCVGRMPQVALGGAPVRHPAHGGAREFRAGLVELLDRGKLALPGPA